MTETTTPTRPYLTSSEGVHLGAVPWEAPDTFHQYGPTRRDPDATYQNVPPDDTELDPPFEDAAGWDLSWGARITFGEDFTFGDGRGLHVTLSTSSDFTGTLIRTVTPDQLRAHAAHLMAVADRAEERRARTTAVRASAPVTVEG